MKLSYGLSSRRLGLETIWVRWGNRPGTIVSAPGFLDSQLAWSFRARHMSGASHHS